MSRQIPSMFVLCLFLVMIPGCSKQKIDTAPTSIAKEPASQAASPEKFAPYPGDANRPDRALPEEGGYSEVGLAKWHGPEKQGNATASGETYDTSSKTGAHRLLPMGTTVEVTNLSNGKSTTLVINDRGPSSPQYKLGLSHAAAKELGMLDQGETMVRISSKIDESPEQAPVLLDETRLKEETLGEKRVSLPEGGGPPVEQYYIQVGSFTEKTKAEKVVASLIEAGYKEARVIRATINDKEFYRVQAGAFSSEESASQALDSLKSSYPGSFILED